MVPAEGVEPTSHRLRVCCITVLPSRHWKWLGWWAPLPQTFRRQINSLVRLLVPPHPNLWQDQRESNPHLMVRSHVFYPLDYDPIENGSHGWARTSDKVINSHLLIPTELRANLNGGHVGTRTPNFSVQTRCDTISLPAHWNCHSALPLKSAA